MVLVSRDNLSGEDANCHLSIVGRSRVGSNGEAERRGAAVHADHYRPLCAGYKKLAGFSTVKSRCVDMPATTVTREHRFEKASKKEGSRISSGSKSSRAPTRYSPGGKSLNSYLPASFGFVALARRPSRPHNDGVTGNANT